MYRLEWVLSVNRFMKACALGVELSESALCKGETSLLLLSHLVMMHVVNNLYL